MLVRRTLSSLLMTSALLAVGFIGLPSAANAIPIMISQESAAGAGDFDDNLLGMIDTFTTGLTTAAFYQYGSPNASSYNGELNGGPAGVNRLSQLFLLEAADGLSLVVVHDSANDGSGGSTRTRWNLTNDTASVLVQDDPSEIVNVSVGGTQFDSRKNWVACCTDGYAIGSLDGDWSMFGQFLASPTGIDSWAAVSSDFGSINLALDHGRRVRITTVAVPAPATLALLGLGLAGMGWVARRKRI